MTTWRSSDCGEILRYTGAFHSQCDSATASAGNQTSDLVLSSQTCVSEVTVKDTESIWKKARACSYYLSVVPNYCSIRSRHRLPLPATWFPYEVERELRNLRSGASEASSLARWFPADLFRRKRAFLLFCRPIGFQGEAEH